MPSHSGPSARGMGENFLLDILFHRMSVIAFSSIILEVGLIIRVNSRSVLPHPIEADEVLQERAPD